MEIVGIIFGIIAVFVGISSAVMNKNARSGSGGNNSYTSRPSAGASSTPPNTAGSVFPMTAARPTPRPAPVLAPKPQVVNQSMAEGTGTEGTESEYGYRPLTSNMTSDMSSNLVEMTFQSYEGIKSRNEELLGTDRHMHPSASFSSIEQVEPYSGSLGTSYVGEGCEEHCNIRYISDTPTEAGLPRLSTLQKIIVFGEAINKRKSAR